MKRVGRLVAGIAGWLLAFFGGIIVIASGAALRRGSPTFGTDVSVFVFYALATIAGVALIRLAWPGLFGRMTRSVAARVRDRSRWHNPLMHGLAIYLGGTLLAAVTGKASILVVLILGCAYAVGSPALIAFRPRWWLNALLSAVVGVLLLGLLTGTAEAVSCQHYGDDAMVMLFPVMVYPVALAVSLALHVSWVARRRREAEAAASAAK